MVFSVVFLVIGVALGIVLLGDIGGQAARMRARLNRDPLQRALYERLPWIDRAFGVWCIVFSVGQLVYFYGLTRGTWS